MKPIHFKPPLQPIPGMTTVAKLTSNFCKLPSPRIPAHFSLGKNEPGVRKNEADSIHTNTKVEVECSGDTMAPNDAKKEMEEQDSNRLKEMILSSAREEAKNQRKQFYLGSHDKAGREKRKQWLQVERELHSAQGLASWSVRSTPLEDQIRMLGYLREAIIEGVSYLIEGTFPPDIRSSDSNPFKLKIPANVEKNSLVRSFGAASRTNANVSTQKYYMWSSLHVARCAIVQDAIDVHCQSIASRGLSTSRPLVILVLEPSVEASTNIEVSSEIDVSSASRNNFFLSEWARACCGAAEIITIVTESSEKMTKAINDILNMASSEGLLSPVLVCLHATGDSVNTSEISLIRNICDTFRALLCVEGSALAMIAQPDRPSGPDQAVNEANILLIDPGSWFGFKMCAVLTRHDVRCRLSEGYQEPSASFVTFSDNDDKQGLSTGPILNLWTVLCRVGLEDIRSRIDEVTALAEDFVHMFENSCNVQAIYDGVGCVIQMSYALSRDDRLMTKKKALESKSAVNNVVFEELMDESRALTVFKIVADNLICLQFAPVRLLSSGTFWVPPREDIVNYANKMQEAVDKYECCLAGSVSFAGRVAKCKDLNPVTSSEGGRGLALCFGAIRVVPHELCTSWRETSSSIDVVGDLTHCLVRELQDSLGDIISRSFLVQQEVEKVGIPLELVDNRKMCSSKTPLCSTVKDQDVIYEREEVNEQVFGLPFLVYFNTNLKNGIPDFLSVEPKQSCRPVEAVRQAALAAELLISAVESITSQWRSNNMISQIPRDLANVAGTEDFIPLTAPRDSLGCNLVKKSLRGTVPYSMLADQATVPMEQCVENDGEKDQGTHGAMLTESDEQEFFSVNSEIPCVELDAHVGVNSSSSSSGCTSPLVKSALAERKDASNGVQHVVRDSREETDILRALNSDQVPAKSHWLGIWGNSGDSKGSAGTKHNGEERKRTPEKQENAGGEENTQNSDSEEQGSESVNASSSSGESEDESEDESRDENGESQEETEEYDTDSSEDSLVEDGNDTGLVSSPSNNESGLAPQSNTGFFSWFQKSYVAEPALSRIGPSITGGSNTHVSEVPSDWISRVHDDWESDKWVASASDEVSVGEECNRRTGKIGKPMAQADAAPSRFGYAWLRRRYLQATASVEVDEDKKKSESEECSRSKSDDYKKESARPSEDTSKSTEDISSDCNSSSSSSWSEENNDETVESENSYSEESDEECSESSSDREDSSQSMSGETEERSDIYDGSESSGSKEEESSSFDENESNSEEDSNSGGDSETVIDHGPDQGRGIESKSRVARYMDWLSPRWVSGVTKTVSPETRGGEEVERRRYAESSSDSDVGNSYRHRRYRKRNARA